MFVSKLQKRTRPQMLTEHVGYVTRMCTQRNRGAMWEMVVLWGNDTTLFPLLISSRRPVEMTSHHCRTINERCS